MKLMPVDSEPAPAVRLSIQGRHGLFLVQRDAEEVMVDAKDRTAPHCTCRLHHPEGSGECEHITLLRACGFLERAA
jgi:hypothetical protein